MDIQVRVIPELQTMIVTAIVLFLLYLIFRKFLYKPVSRYMQNRSSLIQSEIDDAKALKQEAKFIKENQEKIINEAHMESKKIIEDAKKISDEILYRKQKRKRKKL